MSTYCTADEAKSAGAAGSIAELAAAITEASERVERYTSELFTPTALTLQLHVDPDGVARVRKHVQSITSVSWYGIATPIVSTGYRVIGDRIELAGVLGWADVTVLGAEPWNGGFANLSQSREPRVTVVGTFGHSEPPPSVRRATALIAAVIRGSDVDSEVPTQHADSEGNVLPVVPQTQPREQVGHMPLRSRTTGHPIADELLAPYVREPVRIRA